MSDLGRQTISGLRAVHYRAVIGKAWSTDVWVAKGRLIRVAVQSPSGLLVEDFYDYGVPVHINAPQVAAH